MVNGKSLSGACAIVIMLVLASSVMMMTAATVSADNEGATASTGPQGASAPAAKVRAGIDPIRTALDSTGPSYLPGELIVKFRQGVTLKQSGGLPASGIGSVDDLNARFGATVVQTLHSGALRMKIRADADVLDAARQYSGNPFVEVATPNPLLHTLATPNDPLFPQQLMHVTTQAPQAWDITTGSPNVVVAVIDTGVDWNHPDLAANIWVNTDEIPGNGIDDDGNGYIDDVRGWDFANIDNDPMDDMGHGTHCAGLIAGVGNNGIGVTGVTWNCKIMALKAGDAGGGFGGTWIVDALEYAADNGADVVSMSFGGDEDWAPIHQAIQYAYNAGVLLVAAAGNSGNQLPGYPAYYNEVVAVSATDVSDTPAWFSTYGNWIEVSAPGVNDLSTMWNDDYFRLSGTSMACPYTAGVSALIWSKFPTMTRDQVRSQLLNTTDDLGPPGFDAHFGWGRVNARWAVDHTSPSVDLRLWGMNATHVLHPGEATTVSATVQNFGQTSQSSVSVSLRANGGLVQTKRISSIPASGWASVSFSWTPTAAGWYTLEASVASKKGDPTANNAQSTSVLVRAGTTVAYPGDFDCLQKTLSYARDGYTVNVGAGVYLGQHQSVNSISIIGASPDTTIFDGVAQWSSTIWITGDNTTLTGFTMRNGYIGASSHGDDVNVSGNLFLNCFYGVWVDHGKRNTITDNSITVGLEICQYSVGGVVIIDGDYALISRNTITSVGYATYGVGIDLECRSYLEPDIFLDNVTVVDNYVSRFSESGIIDIWSRHDVIRGNRISECGGINWGAIDVSVAESITVEGNTIDTAYYGIFISGFSGSITDNYVDYCPYGSAIYFEQFYDTAFVVSGNTFEDCMYGLYQNKQASNVHYADVFHHNNFIRNQIQIYRVAVDPLTVFDDGQGHGNYWSDYMGADTDEDGIGETNLPWQGVDNYPLMHPWGSIVNVNTGLKYLTVQNAVDAGETLSGHTILVKTGTYSERVVLWNKALTLLGELGGTVFQNYAGAALNIHSTASGSTISGFTVVNCNIGIYVWGNANGNDVNNNTVEGCGIGIYLLQNSGNVVRDNTVTNGDDGIVILQAPGAVQGNLLERNTVTGNNQGILGIMAKGNTFAGNLFQANLRLMNLSTGAPTNNVFYHNNFISNGASLYPTGVNVWDDGYPSGGNYWSDYVGADANHDGIGDTPKVLNANNQDRYPLMLPYDSRIHDVAVTYVTAWPLVVPGGNPVAVNVTVANHGNWTESFEVTAYYGTMAIGTQMVTGLAPNTQTVLHLVWDTTGVPPAPYQIKAVAAAVQGETNTGDNTYIDGTVTVQAAPVKMHVQSITFATSWSGKTQKLSITVTIKDRSGNPVSAATVTGELTLPSGTKVQYSGATGTGGTVTFTYSVRNSALPPGTYVFTVTNVTHATAQYAPAENVETTDSYTV